MKTFERDEVVAVRRAPGSPWEPATYCAPTMLATKDWHTVKLASGFGDVVHLPGRRVRAVPAAERARFLATAVVPVPLPTRTVELECRAGHRWTGEVYWRENRSNSGTWTLRNHTCQACRAARGT